MATPIFKHFDKYTIEERSGNIRIKDENQKMVMIGIQCEDEDMIDLHHDLRNLSKMNESIPMVVPPSQFGDSLRIMMAVRCPDGKIIDNFRDTWFFEFALAYNRIRKNWEQKPFYASLIFKRVILNLIRIVEAFLQTNFRPVLQARKIFVSKEGDVIFSQYEVRDPAIVDHSAEEARQVGDLLKLLVQSKTGNNSETLTAEFQELATWLLSTHFQPGLNGDVRAQVVFWDQKIRIHYINQLFEEVACKPQIDTQIFNRSKDAFKVNGQTNWRHRISEHHPLLSELVHICDEYFRKAIKQNHNPSQFRTNNSTNYTPAQILCCGLAKMRDGYLHDGKNTAELSRYYKDKEPVTDIRLQSMFQDVFPLHMLEFAKSEGLINFRAEKLVQQLLDRTYVEDASSSVEEYMAT